MFLTQAEYDEEHRRGLVRACGIGAISLGLIGLVVWIIPLIGAAAIVCGIFGFVCSKPSIDRASRMILLIGTILGAAAVALFFVH